MATTSKKAAGKTKSRRRQTGSKKSLPKKADSIGSLRRELAEGLEQQAATSEILRMIATTLGDLQSALDKIVKSTARLCNAEDASVRLVDGDVLRLMAHVGPIPTTTVELPIADEPLNQHVLMSGETVHQWNKTLETRAKEQVTQLERLSRLRRFFSPPLAELIVSGDADDPLKTHRRELTVVYLDLRGFTAFAETAEPEEVMEILHEYHAAMGKLILDYEGTLEHFAGDGMMIFFNDPVPVENAAERAVRMTLAMRDKVKELSMKWHKLGHDLDFGVGIAQGYATIGAIGFDRRWEYGAIGNVPNLAARLCGEAKPGEILVPQRLLAGVEESLIRNLLASSRLKDFTDQSARTGFCG